MISIDGGKERKWELCGKPEGQEWAIVICLEEYSEWEWSASCCRCNRVQFLGEMHKFQIIDRNSKKYRTVENSFKVLNIKVKMAVFVKLLGIVLKPYIQNLSIYVCIQKHCFSVLLILVSSLSGNLLYHTRVRCIAYIGKVFCTKELFYNSKNKLWENTHNNQFNLEVLAQKHKISVPFL